jgi:NAD(P)-dependent dehydrogenase (short-subunit alcohol dehydrogenase family)
LRVAVTGGTSGLGRALVEQLHAAGANVAFIARDEGRVRSVARRLPGTHGIAGDVSSKEAIHPMALRINAALGGLDVLIHNASTLGPVPLVPLADTECEDFEQALQANVLGPFRLTRALLGSLAASARQGRMALVVSITSDAAVNAYANWGAYGASKAALAHMSRIWDEELREHGVRFIAHDPGDMDTPLHALALPDADPATLKRPAIAAEELLARIAEFVQRREEAHA